MNALDLPPRRTLPPGTRDRIRRSVDTGIAAPPRRSRAPLAAAAAVALLAASAVAVARWAPGPQEDQPPAATTSPGGSAVRQVTMVLPDSRTTEDLDHCADVVATSPRAGEFAPRSQWRPKFTATTPDGTRITAFLGTGGKPAFCEVTGTTATVSDPTAEWIVLGEAPAGMSPASIFAVYLSSRGVLAGTTDVDALEFSLFRETKIVPVGPPALRQGLFVVNLGEFGTGDHVEVIGRNNQGMSVVTGTLSYAPEHLPPVGATGPIG